MSWNKVATGIVVGLLFPVLGFIAYGFIHTTWIRPHLDMSFFVHDLFLGTRRFQAPILSLSLIANLAPFFLFDRVYMHKAMRGVVIATFIYGAAIVVLLL